MAYNSIHTRYGLTRTAQAGVAAHDPSTPWRVWG